MLAACFKYHDFWPVCFTMLYQKLYSLTDLNANDVNVQLIDIN